MPPPPPAPGGPVAPAPAAPATPDAAPGPAGPPAAPPAADPVAAPPGTDPNAPAPPPTDPAAPQPGRIDNPVGAFSYVIPAGWVESDATHLDYGSALLSKIAGAPSPGQPPPVANDTRVVLGKLDQKLYASAEADNTKAATRLASDMGEFFMPYPGTRVNQETTALAANGMSGGASYYEVKFSDASKPNGQIWAGVIGPSGPNAPQAAANQRWFVVWLGTANDRGGQRRGEDAGRVRPPAAPAWSAGTCSRSPAASSGTRSTGSGSCACRRRLLHQEHRRRPGRPGSTAAGADPHPDTGGRQRSAPRLPGRSRPGLRGASQTAAQLARIE